MRFERCMRKRVPLPLSVVLSPAGSAALPASTNFALIRCPDVDIVAIVHDELCYPAGRPADVQKDLESRGDCGTAARESSVQASGGGWSAWNRYRSQSETANAD